MKEYWYRIFIGECPVCGKNQSYRERVYTKKPKDIKKRHVYMSSFQTYCGCMDDYRL